MSRNEPRGCPGYADPAFPNGILCMHGLLHIKRSFLKPDRLDIRGNAGQRTLLLSLGTYEQRYV